MYKGGYKIIDCKGQDLMLGPTINGIYAAIESTNKRVVFSGAVHNEVELDDFTVLLVPGQGGNLMGRVGMYNVTVTPDDKVFMTDIRMTYVEVPQPTLFGLEDGTYVLKATITDGVCEGVEWVADETQE